MKAEENNERNGSPILIELSTVFIAIALLVALLVPALIRARISAQIAKAKTEMTIICAAISGYETAYAHFPVAFNDTNAPDFTFGTVDTGDAFVGITNSFGYQANNSEAMIILMDLAAFPDGRPTINANHKWNPQRTTFLAVRMAKDTNSPGLGPDYVYRDPWGHPYIITIDRNGDKRCRDAFYRLASVSETAPSARTNIVLTHPSLPPYTSDDARDSFEITNVTVTVWSFGQDGKADKNQKANEGVNKDNITSW